MRTLIVTFLPFKVANEPCGAKFGPLPSKWQMTSPKPPCVNETADWKLKILQNGLYLIYGQVAPNTTYKEPAPFEIFIKYHAGNLREKLRELQRSGNWAGRNLQSEGNTSDVNEAEISFGNLPLTKPGLIKK
ncbi:Tumor Necrosis Factor Ligand Superfamily Member 18 [Manis pentadactyla]|nr:Tumor Necrosis Factor Ligand Superfamily Member 18 [Manis pentadactyla]